jgi:hypothetical protein
MSRRAIGKNWDNTYWHWHNLSENDVAEEYFPIQDERKSWNQNREIFIDATAV